MAITPHLATEPRMAESSANVQNAESSVDGMSNSKSRLVQEDSPLPDTQSTSPFFTVSFGSISNRIEKTLEEPAARIKATISSHTKPSPSVSTESFSPSSEDEKVVLPNATDLMASLDDLKFQTPQDVETAASASSTVDRSPTLLPKAQSLEVKFGNAKMLASREPEIVRIRPQVVGAPATLQASSTHDRLTDSIPIASSEVVVPTQDIAILNQSSTGREGQLLATSASNDVAASGSEMPSTKQVSAPLAMAPKVENTVPVFPIRVPVPSSETPSVTVNPYAVTERDSNVAKIRMSDQVTAPVIAPVLEQRAMVKPLDTSIETNPRPNSESSSKNIADDSKNPPLDNLKTRIRKLAPTSHVDLRQSEDGSITVIGSVPDEETAKKILIMVRRTYLVPVQDRLIVQVP